MLSDNPQEAEAEEVRVKAEFENKTEVARSQRDYQLNKSSYDVEVNTKVSTKFILLGYVNSVTRVMMASFLAQLKHFVFLDSGVRNLCIPFAVSMVLE